MFTTDRLVLRRWLPRDGAPFAAINADPEFADPSAGPLGREQSDALIQHFEADWEGAGFSFAAVELAATGEFIGMVGIARCNGNLPVCPCVEIGWRLARHHWGSGYATEAGRRWLEYGLLELGIPEIVAFTDRGNDRSIAVMRRLGMVHDPARDFEHPDMPEGDPVRPHVVFAVGAGGLDRS